MSDTNTSQQSFYITTTLPYVNAKPHLGHAMEFIRADVIARHKQLLGFDVFFNTGTDEHGSKIHEKAEEKGVDPQSYVDENAKTFKSLLEDLSLLSDIHFVRTTDEHHIRAAQEFWHRCKDDIYKGTYKVKYCVGCELEKTDSDLNDEGKCPDHPDRELEIREEENYFFAFSRYGEKLLQFYEKNPHFVIPDFRLNEVRAFVERGLEDFSISRLKEKMPWGVPVPDDPDHVMYVWFDALVNYISTLGWPEDEEAYEHYWVNGAPTQYAGKDNLRQQSAMWQAMLMSAGLEPSKQIVINGFILNGDQKMSKSLGNVIDPLDIINEYGTDSLRYLMVRRVNSFEDTGITPEHIKDSYNGDLANGLGNLASRVVTMVSRYGVDVSDLSVFDRTYKELVQDHPTYEEALASFRLNKASDHLWDLIGQADEYITQTEPFKVIKEDEETAHKDIKEVVKRLYVVAVLLEPFMPETAERIQHAIKERTPFDQPLFPRKV